MAVWTQAVYDSLRLAMATAMPALATTGIFEAEHAAEIPYSDITLPYGAIQPGEWSSTEMGGTSNEFYTSECTLWIVAEVGGDSGLLRPYLEAIRDQLLHTPITSGQTLLVDSMEWSRRLEPNILFENKNYTQRAGKLAVHLIAGNFVP